jgi:hypothetical protein
MGKTREIHGNSWDGRRRAPSATPSRGDILMRQSSHAGDLKRLAAALRAGLSRESASDDFGCIELRR